MIDFFWTLSLSNDLPYVGALPYTPQT
jgi:hypothetical protein